VNPGAFDWLIAPKARDEFRSEYFGQKALHTQGDDHKFKRLFSWSALNDTLNAAPAPHPEIRLFQNAKGTVRVTDAIDIIRASQSGATLIFENVDRYHLVLGQFLNKLSAEVGESTRCNLYASSPGRQGFPLHFDTHDFFILQIEGYKRWKVFRPTVDEPLFFRKDHQAPMPEPCSLYSDAVLAPGDTLYVPKGHWHEALADREPSLHLTLAMFVKTGIDFLLWLVDELRENVVFRRRFPLLFREERATDGGITTLSMHLEVLERALVDTFANKATLVAAYVAAIAAGQKMRDVFSYPDPMLSNPIETRGYSRFIFPERPVHIAVRDDGNLDIVTAGRILTVPSSARHVITEILSHEPFTIDDLARNVPATRLADVRQLVTKLLRDGLVKPI
jgi:ribosomal protein L16 Arg81 hydroxylase